MEASRACGGAARPAPCRDGLVRGDGGGAREAWANGARRPGGVGPPASVQRLASVGQAPGAAPFTAHAPAHHFHHLLLSAASDRA